jgi:CheY-like chemotaxis protein
VRVTSSVLIVEDDPDVRRLLQELLFSEGFDVRTAEHGAEALRMLRRDVPDLIVLDLVLPWINGIEVLSTIRQDPRLSAVPVLVVTASSTLQPDLNVFEPLILMHKPLDTTAFVSAARALVEPSHTWNQIL